VKTGWWGSAGSSISGHLRTPSDAQESALAWAKPSVNRDERVTATIATWP